MDEMNLDNLCIIQKQLLKIDPDNRIEFIKKKMRVYEPKELQKQNNSENNPSYKSQIDYIYLIWKALEFEHLFDQVKMENND